MTTYTPKQAREFAKTLELSASGYPVDDAAAALRSLADQLEEAQLQIISDFGQIQEAWESTAAISDMASRDIKALVAERDALLPDAQAYRYLRDIDDWAAFCPEWLGAMGIYGKGADEMDAAIAAARNKL